MLKQLKEYLVRLLLKLHFHTALAELGGSQIKLEYAEAIDAIVFVRQNHTQQLKLPLV